MFSKGLHGLDSGFNLLPSYSKELIFLSGTAIQPLLPLIKQLKALKGINAKGPCYNLI